MLSSMHCAKGKKLQKSDYKKWPKFCVKMINFFREQTVVWNASKYLSRGTIIVGKKLNKIIVICAPIESARCEIYFLRKGVFFLEGNHFLSWGGGREAMQWGRCGGFFSWCQSSQIGQLALLLSSVIIDIYNLLVL